MTAIGITIQCSFGPVMCCPNRTDRPNDVPQRQQDGLMPTAATRARVMRQHDDEDQRHRRDGRDQQVVLRAVVHVLV